MSEGIDSLVLVGDYSDGPVTYTITAATLDGVPVQPDLADLFDLVLDRLGGSPCGDGDDWTNPDRFGVVFPDGGWYDCTEGSRLFDQDPEARARLMATKVQGHAVRIITKLVAL